MSDMRLDIFEDARRLPILGYIKDMKKSKVITNSSKSSNKIENTELIYPTLGMGTYITSGTNKARLFVPSATYIMLITNIDCDVSVTFTTECSTLSTSTESVDMYPISNNRFYMAMLQTPSDVVYADFNFNTSNTSFKFYINLDGLIYKYPDKYMYEYKTKIAATDTDSVQIVDKKGNILGSSNYKLETDGSFIKVKSDELNREELYIIYDTDIGMYSYKEPIDPVVNYDSIGTSVPEYGLVSNKTPLFSFGDVPNPIKALGMRSSYLIENQDGTTLFRSMSAEPTYLINLNGSRDIYHSKIIKEKPVLLRHNVISTRHPIKPSYTQINNRYIANNIYDKTGTVRYTRGNDTGINIYVNNRLISNDNIRYIHEDEGYIELKSSLRSSDVKITYSTTPFRYLGIMSHLGITQDANFVSIPTDKYEMKISKLDDIDQVSLTSADDDDSVYGFYHELSGNPIEEDIEISSLDYLVVTITGEGTINIDIESEIDSVQTSVATGSISGDMSSNTSVISVDTNATKYILNITGTGDLYNVQVYYKSDTNGGLFVNRNTDIAYNTIYNIIDNSARTVQDTEDYYVVAKYIYDYSNDSNYYNFIDISKRGGGINRDDIIYKNSGYRRHQLIRNSYDYGDIATNENRPMVPEKFIIVKLPTSIITDLLTKYQRIDDKSDSSVLRQDIINMIYKKVRETLPSGAYFRIYDNSNNPWPSEVIDE